MLGPDPEALELGLEHDLPAARSGGVDRPVVGEHRRRGPVRGPGLLEDPADVDRRRDRQGHRAQTEPAVVVDEVDDLGPSAGEGPVGHVRLPALVGERCLEPDERGPRPLARLRGDQAAPPQDPPDRAHRGDRTVLPGQVPVDRHRPGVKALGQEVRAQRDDLVLKVRGHRPRRPPRPPRTERQSGFTLRAVPGEELVQPAAMDAVRCCELGHRAALAQMGFDQVRPDIHRSTPSSRCLLCPDTSVSDVPEPITIRATDAMLTRGFA